MPSLRHCILTASILLSTVLSTPAYSEAVSLWDLNTSVMALYIDGPTLTFRYHEPRIGLQEEGVVSGTLHFSGTKSGNTYSGTAHVFSKRCGAHPYYVTGTAAENGRSITLNGISPSAFNAACQPIRFREAVLVFSFLQLVSPPPVVVGSIDPDPVAAQEKRLRDLREQQERQARALREQQEHAERVRRERELEELRLAELRTFLSQRQACRKYDAEACDAALRSPHATAQDAAELRSWRDVAVKFASDYKACMSGSLSACDAALASAAGTDAQRRQLSEWRAAASPLNKAGAILSTCAATIATGVTDAIATIRNLPTSTQVAGGIAGALALMIAAMAMRRRRLPHASAGQPNPETSASPPAQPVSSNGKPIAAQGQSTTGWRQRLSGTISRWFAAVSHSTPPDTRNQATTPPWPLAVRDTPGAIAALELAHAYLEEVRETAAPSPDDEHIRKRHLNTLALAARQLEAAHKLDPDAVLEGQDEKQTPFRFTINELKAEALLLEGMTHQLYDTKRAIPALGRATSLNPNNPNAFYVLGLTHAANRNKAGAVEALQRAVTLDPGNISYRKELNRAESLTAAEIAGYKATRAGERIFDAGIKTANAGIVAYNVLVVVHNIFAFVWNVITFPIRVLLAIFRFVVLR